MGMLVLSDPRMLEGAHPKMGALWSWHAAEENEHKTVSFDLHRHIGGGPSRSPRSFSARSG